MVETEPKDGSLGVAVAFSLRHPLVQPSKSGCLRPRLTVRSRLFARVIVNAQNAKNPLAGSLTCAQ